MTDTPHQPLFSNYVLSSWKTGPERRLGAPTLNPTDREGAGSSVGRCLFVLASLRAGRYVFSLSKNLLGKPAQTGQQIEIERTPARRDNSSVPTDGMEADRPGVLPNSSIDNDPASSSSVVMDDDSNDDEWVGVDRANITVTDMTKPRRWGRGLKGNRRARHRNKKNQ